MSTLTLTLNGRPCTGDATPRTSLADFLRETELLTGTHVGCEHGVCGACTVVMDGQPVRACITLAHSCSGRDVRSIEGLATDDVMAQLREAFTAEHALQCGYCTPGMLVTARDIVTRLPDADSERVRLELAGNLCRCTGYGGIVRAIMRVLEARRGSQAATPPKLPAATFARRKRDEGVIPMAAPMAEGGTSGNTPNRMRQVLRIGVPASAVWDAVRDPELVVGCVPGARLLSREGNQLRGEMTASLGPIQASFQGEATVRYATDAMRGALTCQGRDQASGTRLSGQADFTVVPDGDEASRVEIDMHYALRGPLAQLGRGPVVQVFANEIARTVGLNLQARLRNEEAPPPPARLGAGRLLLTIIWRALRRLVSWGHDT